MADREFGVSGTYHFPPGPRQTKKAAQPCGRGEACQGSARGFKCSGHREPPAVVVPGRAAWKCSGGGNCASAKRGFKCSGHDLLWGKKPPTRRMLGLPSDEELERNARRYGNAVYLRSFGFDR